MANLILLIAIAVVAIALLFIRTNAAVVLLAVCSGSVLVEFANKNMAYINGHLNTNLIPHKFTINQPVIEIVLLLLPAIIVAVLMKHSNGPSRWPIQIFPAIATGILGSLLIVPLLNASTQNTLTKNKLWSVAEQYQIPIVAICILISLSVLVLDSYTMHKAKHHK